MKDIGQASTQPKITVLPATKYIAAR